MAAVTPPPLQRVHGTDNIWADDSGEGKELQIDEFGVFQSCFHLCTVYMLPVARFSFAASRQGNWLNKRLGDVERCSMAPLVQTSQGWA